MVEKIAHTRNPRRFAGLWFMDYGSGSSVKDESPNANNGTITNATWTNGYYGKGLSFTGGDAGYVEVSHDSTLNPSTFTLAVWVKMHESCPGEDLLIISKQGAGGAGGTPGFTLGDATDGILGEDRLGILGGSASDGYQLGINNNIAYVDLNDNVVTAITDLADDEWHHIASTYDGTYLRIYVDGELENSSNIGSESITCTVPFIIGNDNTKDHAHVFNGIIDETSILPRAKTAGEVEYDALDLGGRATAIEIKDSVTEYCKSFQFSVSDPEASIQDKYQFLDDVRIFFDTTRMIRGRVMDLERPEYEVVIKGLDYTSRLLDRNITGSKTYKNCELSTIITNDTDGLETYFPDLTDNNVQTTQVTLGNAADDGITWVEKRIFFCFMELAKIAPDYEFYVDANLDIHFEPRRTVDSGLTITQDEFWEYNFPKVGKEVYTEIMVYGTPTSSWKAVKVEDSTSMLTWGSSGRPFRRSAPPLIDFNLTDEEVAKERGLAMLRRYSSPIEPGFGVVMLEDYKALRSGQLVKVEVAELGIDAYYIVLEAVFQVPDMTLSLKLIENRKGHEEELREYMEKVMTLEVRDIDTSSYVWYQHPTPEVSQWEYDWVVTKITPVGNGAERQSYSYGERNVDVRESGIVEEVVDQGTGVL